MEFEAARGVILSCAGPSPFADQVEEEEIARLTRQRSLHACTYDKKCAGTLDQLLDSRSCYHQFITSAQVTMTVLKFYRPYVAPGDNVAHAFKTLRNSYMVYFEPVCGN